VGGDGDEIEYGERLQRVARDASDGFVQWIAEQARENDSLAWWTSRIAERNTLVKSLFHDICYLLVGQGILKDTDGPVLVVAENPNLLNILNRHVQGRTIAVGLKASPLSACTWTARFLYVWMRFFCQSFWAIALARYVGATPSLVRASADKPRVLIRTCMSDGYFGDHGEARDRYFGQLPQYLEDQGYDVVILPWLFQLQKPYLEVLRWFGRSKVRYLIPEEYYTPADLWWAMTTVMRQAMLPRRCVPFQGNDLAPLVGAARRAQMVNTGCARFILYYRLFSRLSRQNVRLDSFVDLFENMASEKPSLLGLRRFYPHVTTIGFQHLIVLPPLSLSMRTNATEVAVLPMPDVIVANSDLTRSQLIAAGFPAARIRVGPSLRFSYLIGPELEREPTNRSVLVALAMDLGTSTELLAKLLNAFPEEEGINFLLKPHPDMTDQMFYQLTNGRPLPGHVERVDGSMEVWLSRAKCAISGATTAAFELAIAGVPLVLVGRDIDIDINPLADFPEVGPPAYTAEDLRERVLQLVDADDNALAPFRDWANRIRRTALSPLTNETMMAFVNHGERPHR